MDEYLQESVWYFENQGGGLLNAHQLYQVMGLLSRMEARDPGLAMHSHRVTGLSMRLARRMNLPADQVQVIRWAGLLHDVGKLQVPDVILNKHAPLNADEWSLVYRHPVDGAETVRQLTGVSDIAGLILTHHERYDGHGYPCGLKGDKIPLGARILALADSFCAMTDERVYRPSMLATDAYREVLRCTGTDFDPMVVDAFVHLTD